MSQQVGSRVSGLGLGMLGGLGDGFEGQSELAKGEYGCERQTGAGGDGGVPEHERLGRFTSDASETLAVRQREGRMRRRLRGRRSGQRLTAPNPHLSFLLQH